MNDLEPRFTRWRIALGTFGALLLLSALSGLFRDVDFDWGSLGLALANFSAAYLGFANRPRFLIKLAVVWTSLDFMVAAWTILIIFLRHVVSTGTWNFSAVH
jgi:hypothetical protein